MGPKKKAGAKTVVTMEDLAEDSRKAKPKAEKTKASRDRKKAAQDEDAEGTLKDTTEVFVVAEDSISAPVDGVALIQVEDLGQVSGLDGTILSQDISIQLATDKDDGTSASVVSLTADESLEPATLLEEDPDTEMGYQIQSPENYRREMLDAFHKNLTEKGEGYADFPVFCNDGIVWSSKFILAAASPMIKGILEDIGPVDDTCLVIPSLSRDEFVAFHDALFARNHTKPSNMFGIIRGCETVGVDIVSTLDISFLEHPQSTLKLFPSLGNDHNEQSAR